MEEKIQGIEKITSKSDVKSTSMEEIINAQEHLATRDRFDTAMSTAQTTKPTVVEKIAEANPSQPQPSLLDQVRESHTIQDTKISPDGLAVKTDELVTKIGQLKETLQNPNLQLKSSTQGLMENRLEHIDNNLKVALSKAGIEVTGDVQPVVGATDRINPIDRFLGFLTDGQTQLEKLGGHLQTLSQQEINPAALLTVQIKVGQIQQEIELFTSLLNKSLESVKTIMNVQV